nr:truncated envelope glycoprotein [Human immunodeficiency virus 1]
MRVRGILRNWQL